MDHALYISVVEVLIDDSQVDMTIKVFEDDMRDAMHVADGKVYISLDANDLPIVETYLTDHIRVTTSCGDVKLSCDGLRLEGDSYQIQLSGQRTSKCNITSVSADHLMEVFSDQRNILHVSKDGEKQFEILQANRRSAEIH